jgi:AcrR family transcriptional regulator
MMPDRDAALDAELPGLRERKKRATRRALGLAALRLAVERGLDAVLVEHIAAAAGVSPRTFNNYFASKHEAICALALDRAARAAAALRERPEDEPTWDAVEAAVMEQYRDAAALPDDAWLAGLRLVTSTPELTGEYLKAQAQARQLLAEAVAERMGVDVRRDLRPRLIAAVVTAAADVAVDHWLHAEPKVALPPLLRRTLGHVAGGIGLLAESRRRERR